MSLDGTTTTSMFVVPVLLVIAWLAGMVLRHRVGWRFFAAAVGASLLCFPGGAIVAHFDLLGASCPKSDPQLCASSSGATLWMDGFFGLVCCGLLLALTLAVTVVRRVLPSAGQKTQR
ncbi:MAG: hypothetical protein JXA67_20085 [Micromonosporaceae bacterium]|nr:hypothetical protein [Micromonosporaceae bacterium]